MNRAAKLQRRDLGRTSFKTWEGEAPAEPKAGLSGRSAGASPSRELRTWFHPGGVAGRHRHHRDPSGVAATGHPSRRESARRGQCQNNIKQLVLALHLRHDAHGSFPMGTMWTNRNNYYDDPRSGWSHIIYPYLEEGAAYNQLPKSAGSQNWKPWWDAISLSANSPTSVVIPTWLCPSDGDGALLNTQAWGTFSLGNYHAFFGGLNLAGAVAGKHLELGPMGIDFGAQLKDITDGSSKTMILGEYLRSRGGPFDQRGMIWGDQPGYGSVYTQLSPNSGSPDLIYVGWCDNQPNANLPCINGDTGPNNTAASRSRHPGGIHVAMCDSSVRFASDDVDLINIWRPLVTIAGQEVVADF